MDHETGGNEDFIEALKNKLTLPLVILDLLRDEKEVPQASLEKAISEISMRLYFPKLSYSDKLIQSTLDLWEPRYGRKLKNDDAEEILTNLLGFFEVLGEIDEESKVLTGEVA